MAEDKPKIVHDDRVGARVNRDTGEVLPPEGEEAPKQKMAKGWDIGGSPLPPFPVEVLDISDTKNTPFQPATVAPELDDAEFAAVQRANRGDADRDNPAVIRASDLRKGEVESTPKVAEMTKAAAERQAADQKARDEKRAAEAAKAEVPLGARPATTTTNKVKK
jgi:hypothetical protein